jgi:acyl-coenzyme A thioesterase PaaI-like protein
MLSLQDKYAARNQCCGCGPSNLKGLQIKSFPNGEFVTAEFQAQSYHAAFDNMLSGGICGTLLDCHSNWTAAYHLMEKTGQSEPACTVTAEYSVKLLAPTPMSEPIKLKAWVVESSERKAIIEASLTAGDQITATCRGVFVAIKEGHPAYHRW